MHTPFLVWHALFCVCCIHCVCCISMFICVSLPFYHQCLHVNGFQIIQHAPPEHVASVIEQSLVLSCGGSRLPPLEAPVMIAEKRKLFFFFFCYHAESCVSILACASLMLLMTLWETYLLVTSQSFVLMPVQKCDVSCALNCVSKSTARSCGAMQSVYRLAGCFR